MTRDLVDLHSSAGEVVSVPAPREGDRVRVPDLRAPLNVTGVEIVERMLWITGRYPRTAGRGPNQIQLSEPYTAVVTADQFTILGGA